MGPPWRGPLSGVPAAEERAAWLSVGWRRGLAEPWLVAGLAEEIGAAPDASGRSPGLEALAFRALGAFTRSRPALLWMEDAGQDPEALALAQHLLLRQEADPMPLLVLITGPMPPIAGVEAVPPDLEDGDQAPIFDEIDGAALARALGGRDSEILRCAEQGAALGELICEEEWRELCGAAVPTTAAALVEAGLARALPLAEGPGWTFTQPGLRAALLQHATHRGRRAAHHRRAAEALSGISGPMPGACKTSPGTG